MASKNNRRTQMTKLLLKTSLIDLMHNKSINQITIKELCENADLNRSTFYLHYADQYALLKEIEEEIIFKTQEHLANINSETNVNTILYVTSFLDYIKANKEIFYTLLCRQDNISFQTMFLNIAMDRIKGIIPLNCPTEYYNYIFDYVMHGSICILVEWIKSDFDLSSQKLAQLMFRLSDHSLSSFDS